MPSSARVLLLIGAACLPAAGGCGVDCGSPSQVDGRYAVFANALEIREVTNEENFPSYESPGNGWSEWILTWDELLQDEVLVDIDRQTFPAVGVWNEIECGNFTLEITGDYLSETGSLHSFTADAQFIQYASQLEGLWDYSEVWTSVEGEQGTFVIDGQVNGTVIGGS
jgi:hypothetical protein